MLIGILSLVSNLCGDIYRSSILILRLPPHFHLNDVSNLDIHSTQDIEPNGEVGTATAVDPALRHASITQIGILNFGSNQMVVIHSKFDDLLPVGQGRHLRHPNNSRVLTHDRMQP